MKKTELYLAYVPINGRKQALTHYAAGKSVRGYVTLRRREAEPARQSLPKTVRSYKYGPVALEEAGF